MVNLVFLCDGHGPETPGKRTPYITELRRSIRENEFNKPVVDFLDKELKRIGNFHVYQVAPSDEDVPLEQRTDFANRIYWQYCDKYGKANVKAIYVSIHYNALDGRFDGNDPSGFSLHIYPKSVEGRKLAQSILNHLKGGTKQVNRGIKEDNFHVLRETMGYPAVLTENGFMDNKTEALLMLDINFQKEVAQEHAKGICDYFGIKYKVEEEDDMLQKAILIGGFPDMTFAEVLAARTKAPIYTRAAYPGGKVAKELYVVGGSAAGLQADKIINLSGKDRFEVAAAVDKFLK